MNTCHLTTVSRQPALACEVPTSPAFITTFQCIGQFIQNLIGEFTGGGLDTLATAATSLVGLGANLLFLFTKFFPIEVQVEPD